MSEELGQRIQAGSASMKTDEEGFSCTVRYEENAMLKIGFISLLDIRRYRYTRKTQITQTKNKE